MSRKEEVYIPALDGKNIPILTLDNKWHRLFTQTGVSDEILKQEEVVNELLKKQGKATNDIKDYKRLKQKLMNEIVSLMGDDQQPVSPEADKKQNENKRLIEECNEKIEAAQDVLMDLDSSIYRENKALMLMSMEVCYGAIKENTEEIKQIEQWINDIRIELKKNVVRKQEKEIYNEELYTYMHDIFGPEVIEIFDMKYNPDDNPMKKNGRMVISSDSREVKDVGDGKADS
ncbi:MAG: hypothetical protein K6E84_04190 [Lachnospiraceae bacterium]|nr:hypothetical protein [Lachnospiraceae bacterium]